MEFVCEMKTNSIVLSLYLGLVPRTVFAFFKSLVNWRAEPDFAEHNEHFPLFAVCLLCIYFKR